MQPITGHQATTPGGLRDVGRDAGRDGGTREDLRGTSWPSRTAEVRDDRSVVELLRELSGEASTLVRQEVALAKAEMSEKAARVGRNVGYLAAGGLVAFAGMLTLLAAAGYGLYVAMVNAGMDPDVAMWLAPAIVGAVVLTIGAVLVVKAIATLKEESVTPRKTAETLRETKAWMKEKIS